jgi:hypothetical protein
MSNLEARQILALFRPGTADEQDDAFDAARQLAKSDPDLARWFEEHCEAYLILRQKFRSIRIPPGLKEQILSERKIQRPFFQRYWGPLLAVAAAVALLIGIESGYLPLLLSPHSYPAYRQRMTEEALGGYYMDLLSKDPVAIRKFLAEKKAPADYSLPAGLQSAAVVGCAVASWQSNAVSLICFKTGRPLEPGVQSDLWLFVTERNTVPNAPPPGGPLIARVKKATTATWSDESKVYLLAVAGDEAFLRKYLQ